jgi:hypothetical protein
MRLARLTDLHLNFLHAADADAFIRSVADVEADAFLLSADIGEADNPPPRSPPTARGNRRTPPRSG